jgi:ATP-dependent protease HslVU peptidase subunit
MSFHATTILAVKKDGKTAIAGDGQVTLGHTVFKSGAKKIRKIEDKGILAGFAGTAADAFTLFDKFEKKLDEHGGNLRKACVELAKDWRSDKILRTLDAMLIVADKNDLLILSGTGDVLEPDDNIAAIGSGGTYALSAAKAEMKERQKKFAAKLASYADVYVMDAFGTAHRKHASTAVIADSFDKDHKMLGFLMEKEVKAVDAVLGNIKRPFTAIMGGSKVSTKIGIIENLLTKVDNLILCGGMTYTFSKALGGKIGMSICEDDKLDVALDVIKKAKENGVNLVLGTDSICGDDFKNDCNTQVCPSNNIPDGWEGMDAGPETRKAFAAAIKGAKTILWNGPAGVFEFDNFAGGSKAIADAIAEATKEGAFSLIGGGDSVACINKFG